MKKFILWAVIIIIISLPGCEKIEVDDINDFTEEEMQFAIIVVLIIISIQLGIIINKLGKLEKKK